MSRSRTQYALNFSSVSTLNYILSSLLSQPHQPPLYPRSICLLSTWYKNWFLHRYCQINVGALNTILRLYYTAILMVYFSFCICMVFNPLLLWSGWSRQKFIQIIKEKTIYALLNGLIFWPNLRFALRYKYVSKEFFLFFIFFKSVLLKRLSSLFRVMVKFASALLREKKKWWK